MEIMNFTKGKNIRKSILALFTGTVATMAGNAQIAAIHGYTDYTNFPLGQTFSKDTEGEWSHTDPSAEFGSFYNGRTELNSYVDAANFHFVLGVRLDASLGSWYENYNTADEADGTAGTSTYFHQGNLRVDLLKGQFRIHTGKFEEWNCGYIADGYVMEAQNIRNLADRDQGQHFSGIELLPYGIRGLSLIGGFPVLPVDGNGINYAEHNKWKNLLKKIKLMGKYQFDNAMTVAAGLRPETHYEGTENYSEDSYFSEFWLQLNSPKASDSFAWNATYDFRRRDVEEVGEKAFMHFGGISGRINLTDNLALKAEYRLAYASEHYIVENEKLFYETLGLDASYNIPNSSSTLGLKFVRASARDSNGTLFDTDARIQGNYSDDLAMTVDWMPHADAPGAGSKGSYHSFYFFPYYQKDFRNGHIRTGAEMQLTIFDAASETKAFGYRIPVAICFAF